MMLSPPTELNQRTHRAASADFFNTIGHDRKATTSTTNDRSWCENWSFAAMRTDGEVAPQTGARRPEDGVPSPAAAAAQGADRPEVAMLFFEFPENARWNEERDCIEFSVLLRPYEGTARVGRRVFQGHCHGNALRRKAGTR